MDGTSVPPVNAIEDNDIAKSYQNQYRFLVCIPCILTFLADAAALLSIFIGQLWRRNVQNLLITNMCLSSLIYSVTYTLMEIELWNMVMRQEYAAMIPLICIKKYLIIVFSFSLLSLTIEQHLTITYPLTYAPKMTPRKMTFLTVGVWILGLIDIIASASLWDYGKLPDYFSVMPVWYILVSCITFLLFPSLVSTVLQICNLCKARKQMVKINAQLTGETLNINMKEQVRKIITNIIVLLIFCLFWMSIQVDLLLPLVARSREKGSHYYVMYNFTRGVQCFFCLCIPVIYAIRMKDISGQLQHWYKKVC